MPPISQTLALLSFAAMASVPHKFVTVDMRGLRAALIERSQGERVSVSSLVRAFVASGLGSSGAVDAIDASRDRVCGTTVRLSIRLSSAEARDFAGGARAAGLSQAAYLAELIAVAPRDVTSATRAEQLAALAAGNAELSTLNRNVRHLTVLLGRGSVQAAREYRAMLDSVAGDVRRYLTVASAVLAEVRSRRRLATGTRQTSPTLSEGNHG